MLTTIDNPFNPFTQFDEWYRFDTDKGYHSLSYLARVANLSEELSPLDEHVAIESAIDDVVRENVLGIYRKVIFSENEMIEEQS